MGGLDCLEFFSSKLGSPCSLELIESLSYGLLTHVHHSHYLAQIPLETVVASCNQDGCST